MEDNRKWIVKEDMICPVTGEHCDDECCPVGAICNLSGNEGMSPELQETGKTTWTLPEHTIYGPSDDNPPG